MMERVDHLMNVLVQLVIHFFQEKNDNIEPNSFDEVENIETDINNGTPIASKHDNGRKRKLPI